MILISHRGNIDGRNPDMENNPSYIMRAVRENFDVENPFTLNMGRTANQATELYNGFIDNFSCPNLI